jgi:hypothetical protein
MPGTRTAAMKRNHHIPSLRIPLETLFFSLAYIRYHLRPSITTIEVAHFYCIVLSRMSSTTAGKLAIRS